MLPPFWGLTEAGVVVAGRVVVGAVAVAVVVGADVVVPGLLQAVAISENATSELAARNKNLFFNSVYLPFLVPNSRQ